MDTVSYCNMPSWAEQGTGVFQDLDQIAIEDTINGSIEHADFVSVHIGRQAKAHIDIMTDMRCMLTRLGWTNQKATLLPDY